MIMELKKTIFLFLIFPFLISFFAECRDPISSPSPYPPESTLISGSPEQSPSSTIYDLAPTSSIDEAEAPSLLQVNPVPIKKCDKSGECQASGTKSGVQRGLSESKISVSDPTTALKNELQALQQAFEKAQTTATQISQNPDTPPSTKSDLETCLDMYDSGISDVENALSAITVNDIGRIKASVSATVTDIGTCVEAYSEGDTPLNDLNAELSQIASNNLDLADALPH